MCIRDRDEIGTITGKVRYLIHGAEMMMMMNIDHYCSTVFKFLKNVYHTSNEYVCSHPGISESNSDVYKRQLRNLVKTLINMYGRINYFGN